MNDFLIRTLIATALAAIIAAAARKGRSLSDSGALAAWIIGTVVVAGGGWLSGGLLVLFFATSSALSKSGRRSKPENGLIQRGSRRDAVQVIANGGVAALCACLMGLDPSHRTSWFVALAGSLAAVTADTWATEIGRRSRSVPRSIVTGQPVPRGTSGGVTVLGTLGSIAGALVIAIAAGIGSGATSIHGSQASLIAAIALAGLAGSIGDSLLGARLQALYRCPSCGQRSEQPVDACGRPGTLVKGWPAVNNDVVNVACAVLGAAVGLAMSLL